MYANCPAAAYSMFSMPVPLPPNYTKATSSAEPGDLKSVFLESKVLFAYRK
jgi:hypothetical protein